MNKSVGTCRTFTRISVAENRLWTNKEDNWYKSTIIGVTIAMILSSTLSYHDNN